MRWLLAIGVGLLAVGCNPFGEEPSRLASFKDRGVIIDGAPPNLVRYPTQLSAKTPLSTPDQTAVRHFAIEHGASTEIEAVCDIRAGTDALCWKPDGATHEAFTRRLRRRFGNPPPGASRPPRSSSRKIRLVIARVVMGGTNDLELLSIGSNRGKPNVSLPSRSLLLEGEPDMYYFGGYAQEPLGTRQTSMRFALNKPLAEKPVMERAVGAKVVFGHETYTLQSMEFHPIRRRKPGRTESEDHWVLNLSRELKAKRDVMLLITPLDAQGHPIVFLDDDGNPLPQELKTRRPHLYRIAECNIVGSPSPDRVVVSLNFDPTKAAAFRFEGSTRKVLDITGIPMDPARK